MISLKVNKIIKYLLLSDLVFWTGWGLVSPILAIYVVRQIAGGTELVVGIATVHLLDHFVAFTRAIQYVP